MRQSIIWTFCFVILYTITTTSSNRSYYSYYNNRLARPTPRPAPAVPQTWEPTARIPNQSPAQPGQCRAFGPDPKWAPSGRRMVLGILIYDGVEVLDMSGPFEVFAVTGEIYNRFRVVLISTKKQVTAVNGLKVIVDHVIGEPGMPDLNVLVLPGSSVNSTRAAVDNHVNMNFIKGVEPKLDYIISVCTGLAFLGRAGLADGLDVTTHHQLFDELRTYVPRATMRPGWRFTDNGRILTSAGISAGIDVSLYFVKRMFGKPEADGVVRRMEYDWKDWTYDSCRGPILPAAVRQ